MGAALTAAVILVGSVLTSQDETGPPSEQGAPYSDSESVSSTDRVRTRRSRTAPVSRNGLDQRGGESPVTRRRVRIRARALSRLDAQATRRSNQIEANRWKLPLSDYRVTARFGATGSLWSTVHTGVDLAAPTGTRVDSVAQGLVTSARYDGAYGNKVVVRHADGTEVWYPHLDSISVTEGETLSAGQEVGKVGSTGNVTGPHLHLEVRPAGVGPVDPLVMMRERGSPLE